ncbi:hypothetical protein GA0115239_115012 [Streptomyces sp. BpilaLS-43]|nr:hypothetical protein GA0115239_115012 [Streptomyces sp. BpilaLS-43]
MRRHWALFATASRYALIGHARNRFAMLLVVVYIPVWIALAYLTIPDRPAPFRLRATGEILSPPGNHLTQITGALNAVTLIAGFMMFAATFTGGAFDRRLAMAGYPRFHLVLSKLAALTLVCAAVAAYATAAAGFAWSPRQPLMLATALFCAALTYGALGVVFGSVLRREVEGMFAILMISIIDLALQNPLSSSGSDSGVVRFLPSYGAVQASMSAAFFPRVGGPGPRDPAPLAHRGGPRRIPGLPPAYPRRPSTGTEAGHTRALRTRPGRGGGGACGGARHGRVARPSCAPGPGATRNGQAVAMDLDARYRNTGRDTRCRNTDRDTRCRNTTGMSCVTFAASPIETIQQYAPKVPARTRELEKVVTKVRWSAMRKLDAEATDATCRRACNGGRRPAGDGPRCLMPPPGAPARPPGPGRRARDTRAVTSPAEEGAHGLAAPGPADDGGDVGEVVDHGPAEPSGTAPQVGSAHAWHPGAVVVDGDLDRVAVGRQTKRAGTSAVAQRVGDELRDDQDDGVGGLACDGGLLQ